MMPLSFYAEGVECTVKKVGGGPSMRQHLNELGFSEGAPVKVVSRHSGNVIVCVRGSKLAMNCGIAQKIMV